MKMEGVCAFFFVVESSCCFFYRECLGEIGAKALGRGKTVGDTAGGREKEREVKVRQVAIGHKQNSGRKKK